MIAALVLLMASIGRPSLPTLGLVFAAIRFEDHFGSVYPVAASHLYFIRTDQSGLRQLTYGEHDDRGPTIAPDGRHILFWRSVAQGPEAWKSGDHSLRLCSIGLDGSGLQTLGPITATYQPYAGLTRAYARFGKRSIREKEADYEVRYSLSAPRRRTPVRNSFVQFSPDGTKAIAYPNSDNEYRLGSEPSEIVDLRTGRVVKIRHGLTGAIWAGSNCIVTHDANRVVLLDPSGRPLMRARVREDSDKDEMWTDGTLTKQAFPLSHTGSFLLQAHHAMSDGGFDYTYRVDLGKGRAVEVARASGYSESDNGGRIGSYSAQGIEDVSPDGRQFLATEWAWVGGYKNPGAAKLSKLMLWDSRRLRCKQIGFRLMLSLGACFVPSPKK